MIILLIISLVILSGLIRVNAQTLTNWAEGLPTLNRVQMYECQTSNKCYNKEVNIQGLVTVNGNRDIAISQSLTLDSGGISIQTNVNELKEGYLYLTNYYVCANYSLNDVDALIYNSYYGTPGVANSSYNSTSIATLSNIPGSGEQEFTSCKLYSGLYVPNVANNWATLRLKKTSSQTGTYISLIAVENKELGIYSDTIKRIVENSNGNVQQAVDRVNDTLNQNHEYNNNASQNTENEKQEMENYEQKEDSLRNGLDLNIEESKITINPEANTLIWNIVDRLRGMSGKIVLLFTSVLSLGIMKMVLGR